MKMESSYCLIVSLYILVLHGIPGTGMIIPKATASHLLDECSINQVCVDMNTECLLEESTNRTWCLCKDGYGIAQNGRLCLPRLGSKCTPSIGCLNPVAVCKQSEVEGDTCQCPEGHDQIGDTCQGLQHDHHIHIHEVIDKDIAID